MTSSTQQVPLEILISVISEIDQIYQSQIIHSIDFIPSVDPPYVLYAEKTLGIGYGIVKSLFRYLYQQSLFSIQQKNHRNIVSQSDPQDFSSQNDEAERNTRILLFLRGDLSVIYNLRKTIILHHPKKYLEKEIPLTKMIFSKHPKSPSGWEHRRWCYKLRHQLSSPHTENASLTSLLRLNLMEVISETELCKDMAEKYPKNYYAWTHRLWVLPFYELPQIEDEIMFTKDWMLRHPSDHSAVNHRIQVISWILQHPELLSQILQSLELDQYQRQPWKQSIIFLSYLFDESSNLMKNYLKHESLWQYKKLLFLLLLNQHRVEKFSINRSCPELLISLINNFCKLLQTQSVESAPCKDSFERCQTHEDNYLWDQLIQEVYFVSSQSMNGDKENQVQVIKFGSRYLSTIFSVLLRDFKFENILLKESYNSLISSDPVLIRYSKV